MARPEITGKKVAAAETYASIDPAAPPTGPPRTAFTITEFCQRHRISRAQYYRLKNLGLGPDELRFNDGLRGVVRITVDAEREWRQRHTKRSVA